jgi:hypothetical protein
VRLNLFPNNFLAPKLTTPHARARSLVLQLVALLNAKETSNVAIGSIMISTASTALTATTMFWDWDTDPGNRKRSPDW